LEGDIHLSYDEETLGRLKSLLKKYNLNAESRWLRGEDPEGNTAGYLETIQGVFSIPPDQYASFVHSFFKDVQRLEPGYRVRMEKK